MQTEFDRFTRVIQLFGFNRTAVKHALRMRKKHMHNGDMEAAAEWYIFALAILRRLRKGGRKIPEREKEKVTLH